MICEFKMRNDVLFPTSASKPIVGALLNLTTYSCSSMKE